jgi:hypothetical protein
LPGAIREDLALGIDQPPKGLRLHADEDVVLRA